MADTDSDSSSSSDDSSVSSAEPESRNVDPSVADLVGRIEGAGIQQQIDMDVAAVMMQCLVRRAMALLRARKMLKERFAKKLDSNSGYFYYLDTKTNQSQWLKPKMLGEYDDVPLSPRTAAKAELLAEAAAAAGNAAPAAAAAAPAPVRSSHSSVPTATGTATAAAVQLAELEPAAGAGAGAGDRGGGSAGHATSTGDLVESGERGAAAGQLQVETASAGSGDSSPPSPLGDADLDLDAAQRAQVAARKEATENVPERLRAERERLRRAVAGRPDSHGSSRSGGGRARQLLVASFSTDLWLRRYNLRRFVTLFLEEGFDDLDSCLEIEDGDLELLGVRRGQRKVLLRAVRELREEVTEAEEADRAARGHSRLEMRGDTPPAAGSRPGVETESGGDPWARRGLESPARGILRPSSRAQSPVGTPVQQQRPFSSRSRVSFSDTPRAGSRLPGILGAAATAQDELARQAEELEAAERRTSRGSGALALPPVRTPMRGTRPPVSPMGRSALSGGGPGGSRPLTADSTSSAVLFQQAAQQLKTELILEILHEGTEEEYPVEGDMVKVHFDGYLPDGSKFESSRERKRAFIFKLGAGTCIRGFEIALSRMTRGSRARFLVPPELGYGAAGRPPRIPPNCPLEFDCQLVDCWEPEPVLTPRDPMEGDD